MIRVGQVAGAYGVGGSGAVNAWTDFADSFESGAKVLLEGAEREVERSRPGHPRLVVKFRGLDNRTVADLFRGHYLEIPETSARPLAEGKFYHHQVVGLTVLTSSGQKLGVIAEILERPANDVWVSRDGSVEHLIPATKDAVVQVDVDAGRVVVADWLVQVEDARD